MKLIAITSTPSRTRIPGLEKMRLERCFYETQKSGRLISLPLNLEPYLQPQNLFGQRHDLIHRVGHGNLGFRHRTDLTFRRADVAHD